MKRFMIFAFAFLSIILLYACSAQSENSRIPNPIVEADDASEFDALKLPIEAPNGTDNVRYSIIGNEIAQIEFTLDGISYTYRAAHTTDDISGVFEAFEDTQMVLIDANGWTAAIEIKMVKDGDGALAAWQFGETAFTLYTPDSVSDDTISHTAMELAEEAFLAFGVADI